MENLRMEKKPIFHLKVNQPHKATAAMKFVTNALQLMLS
ncbi:MAG: hypothetical protein UR60_C0044G0004 [Candidatus Moranbacteria bacterium GW2011_GWF2_34_56]|nr:MAG: hypothetical protein UR51_C0022G0003 [Candidatus Moranbacteria bacterium GW2011_GWF1_34_10]KKP63430.1 MAG: hypothetical protein UR60_C0044G0004 [Candidatus Moranbacteria bacterium GW2011_GWF2_34_56]